MSNTKIEEKYIYNGLGYPIALENVRFYWYNGIWEPIIDINRIALAEYRRLIYVEPERRTQEQQWLFNAVRNSLE